MAKVSHGIADKSIRGVRSTTIGVKMVYKTESGNFYEPNKNRLLINISNSGHYEILLVGGHKITYINKEAFENEIENNGNPFFRRVFRKVTGGHNG